MVFLNTLFSIVDVAIKESECRTTICETA